MNKFCRFTVVNTNICYSFIIFVTCQRCWSYWVCLVLWGSKLHTLLPDVWQMERIVKSGELPQLVSSVPHLDLHSHVLPSFCDFSSFLLKFQKDGIIYERSFLNIMAEGGGGKKEQKQVSPLNRPLPDLPGAKWLGCPLHKVSMTLNKMIGFVNGITVHGWL